MAGQCRQATHKGRFCPQGNVCRGLEQAAERAPHIAKHYHCERCSSES